MFMLGVGQSKAEVMRRRLLEAVPWSRCEAVAEMFRLEDADRLLAGDVRCRCNLCNKPYRDDCISISISYTLLLSPRLYCRLSYYGDRLHR